MPTLQLRNIAVALALFGCGGALSAGAASAQDTGPQPTAPGGPLPGPNATPPQTSAGPAPHADVQATPGAMPGSDTVPSGLSAKNAADDRLPTVAYTFKDLPDDQRLAIYQIITGKTPGAAPPSAATAAEVGTLLPASVALSAVPRELTAQIPQTIGYEYARAGDKVLLVSPVNRVVVGVIAP
jgi:hypothetical protein